MAGGCRKPRARRQAGWQGGVGDALALAQDVVGKGNQGTRHKYQEFAGRAELARALETVPRFTPV